MFSLKIVRFCMFCTLKSGFPVCGRPLFGVRLVLDIGMTGREVSQPVQLVCRQQIHFLLGEAALAAVEVGRADYYVGHVAAGERVPVLDEHAFV